MEFQEDLAEDRLPNCHNLLYQIGFKGGGTFPLDRPETMEGVMQDDNCCKIPVEDYRLLLPQDL